MQHTIETLRLRALLWFSTIVWASGRLTPSTQPWRYGTTLHTCVETGLAWAAESAGRMPESKLVASTLALEVVKLRLELAEQGLKNARRSAG